MSLKLRLASIWMPEYLLKKEIDRVARVTTQSLDHLILKYAPEKLHTLSKEKFVMKGNIAQRRQRMALAHNLRVKILVDELGCNEAIKVGRDALFKAGIKLGCDAQRRLHLGDSLQDLIRAARILYRVLGIEFEIEKSGEKMYMMVNRCSLSNYYKPETCMILSAADEGVVQGLNQDIHMNFTQRMTEGNNKCKAQLKY